MGNVTAKMVNFLKVTKILCSFNILYLVNLLILVCAIQQIPQLVSGKHVIQERRAMLDLYENDTCKNGGICKKDSDCKEVITWIKNKQKPDICSFSGHQPIVCCPTPTDDYKFKQRPSERMCGNYTKEVCPNWVDNIYGGTNAKPKELPFMALIGYSELLANVKWLCGGSLISHFYIITAAHCVISPSSGDPARWSRLGELNYADNSDIAKPQDIAVAARFTHPSYNKRQVYFDIALLKLSSKVIFSEFIKPICLNQATQLTSTSVVAAGWGRTSAGGPLSKHLRKVNLNVVDRSLCLPLFNGNSEASNGFVDEMICAGKLEGGSDTCSGDSGAPLYLPLERGKTSECDLYTQIGLTSFGHRICGLANYPSVYTSVAHYLTWIEGIVWPE